MPSTTTTYGNGGVQNVSQGGYGLPFDPNGMMGRMDEAAAYARQRAAQDMALRQRQMQLQEESFGLRRGQVERGNQMEDTDRERSRAEQLRALLQGGGQQGEAMYVKPMTGMNMSGGYGQAQPWEQGAAFAGYAPRGSKPNNSQFSPPNPAQGQVNMGGPNIGQPIQQPQLDESLASRYFKQFGAVDVPQWMRQS